MKSFIKALSPNEVLSGNSMRIITATEVFVAVLLWWIAPSSIIPKPTEVFQAWIELVSSRGLIAELGTSFLTIMKALGYTIVISLGLAYLTVIPVMRPIVTAISKLRFLGLIGLTFVFTLMSDNGSQLKTILLTFGTTVFFVTGMAKVVASVPREDFDHARTLRMSEWRVVWQVIVRGRMDEAIEMLRQNAAMGWMMLSMVEGIVRSGGGIGTLLLNENKHLHLDAVFALQLTILVVGIILDYSIGLFKEIVCPYASLEVEMSRNEDGGWFRSLLTGR